MGLLERLRDWKKIRAVRPAEESAAEVGGREAERLLSEMIGASFHFQDAHVLLGRRVPSRRQGRRREIDLIVCTPARIHLVEVKNWSGHLAVEGSVWRQTRRRGEVVEHRSPLESNLDRRDSVAEYLSDHGLPLDPRFVKDRLTPMVVFMNPNLDLDPSAEARPDVLSRRELDAYLGRQRGGRLFERLFTSMIQFCLDRQARSDAPAPIPPPQYERIVGLLTGLGTWDRLHLHGGKVVKGDLIRLGLGARTLPRAEVLEAAGGAERPIALRWTRGAWLGWFKVLTGLGRLGTLALGRERRDVSPDDVVTFHEVGEPGPGSRPLACVDQIVLG